MAKYLQMSTISFHFAICTGRKNAERHQFDMEIKQVTFGKKKPRDKALPK